MHSIIRTAILLALLGLAASHVAAKSKAPKPADYCGDIDLDQSWNCAQREAFWFSTQGSRMLPYQWFLHLEQRDSMTLFRSDANMDELRFITAPASKMNPDALPVGFARDDEKCTGQDCWVGLTCAACHTARIDFKGRMLIVDGAPGMIDFSRFLDGLVAALEATDTDPIKFRRFADGVLGAAATMDQRQALHDALHAQTGELRRRADDNHPPYPYGFARVDAFGHIFNQVMAHDLKIDKNVVAPNAPVSYPCLWDTPQHDYVQWNGSAPNHFPGNPLFRNLGEVLGVFGTVDITPAGLKLPEYSSSANLDNLRNLEELVRHLTSPQWPRSLITIDEPKRALGEKIYKQQHCNTCHPILKDRKNLNRHIRARRIPVSEVGTDPLMTTNFATRSGKTGRLERTLIPPLIFGDKASAKDILTNVIFGVWWKNGRALDRRSSRAEVFKKDKDLLYKARPLNGVWATAPYLHNGSVPNLWELLSPSRQPSFQLGDRTFDPMRVGFVSSGSFVFDTSPDGNKNTGHPYGTSLTDGEKWELIEYLKSL